MSETCTTATRSSRSAGESLPKMTCEHHTRSVSPGIEESVCRESKAYLRRHLEEAVQTL